MAHGNLRHFRPDLCAAGFLFREPRSAREHAELAGSRSTAVAQRDFQRLSGGPGGGDSAAAVLRRRGRFRLSRAEIQSGAPGADRGHDQCVSEAPERGGDHSDRSAALIFAKNALRLCKPPAVQRWAAGGSVFLRSVRGVPKAGPFYSRVCSDFSTMIGCGGVLSDTLISGGGVRVAMNQNRSEEHTSELQSHSFISYAVFCLKKKNHPITSPFNRRSSAARAGWPTLRRR